MKTNVILCCINFFSNYPRKGYAFYKGPHNLEDIYFAGFEKNDYFNSGAISFQLNNIYFTGSQSSIKNALYAFEDSVSMVQAFI